MEELLLSIELNCVVSLSILRFLIRQQYLLVSIVGYVEQWRECVAVLLNGGRAAVGRQSRVRIFVKMGI